MHYLAKKRKHKRGVGLVGLLVATVVLSLVLAGGFWVYKQFGDLDRAQRASTNEHMMDQAHVDALHGGNLVQGTSSEDDMTGVHVLSELGKTRQQRLESVSVETVANQGSATEELVTIGSSEGTAMAAAAMTRTDGVAAPPPTITNPNIPVVNIWAVTAGGVDIPQGAQLGHPSDYRVHWTSAYADALEVFYSLDGGTPTSIGTQLNAVVGPYSTPAGAHTHTFTATAVGNGAKVSTSYSFQSITYVADLDATPNPALVGQDLTISWDTNYPERYITLTTPSGASSNFVSSPSETGTKTFSIPQGNEHAGVYTFALYGGSDPLNPIEKRNEVAVTVTPLTAEFHVSPTTYVYEGDTLALDWTTNAPNAIIRSDYMGMLQSIDGGPSRTTGTASYIVPNGAGTRVMEMHLFDLIPDIEIPLTILKKELSLTYSTPYAQVLTGDTITLTWVANGYTQFDVLKDVPSPQQILATDSPADKRSSGSTTYTPTAAGKYTFYPRTNGWDWNSAKQVKITVVDPSTTLSVSPATIDVSGDSAISWGSNYGTSSLQVRRASPLPQAWTTIDSMVRGDANKSLSHHVSNSTMQLETWEVRVVGDGVQRALESFTLYPLQSASCTVTQTPTWSGDVATVQWSSQGYADVRVQRNTVTQWSGSYGYSGSQSQPLNAGDYTYRLWHDGTTTTCSGGSFTVKDHSASISVSPSSMVSGNNATVTWSTDWPGAYVTRGTATQWTGLSGTKSQSITNTGTSDVTHYYHVRSSDGTIRAQDGITVQPPWNHSCSVGPTSIYEGNQTRVQWSTNEANPRLQRNGSTQWSTASGDQWQTLSSAGSYSYSLVTDLGSYSCGSVNVSVPLYWTIYANKTSVNTGEVFRVTWDSNQSGAYGVRHRDSQEWHSNSYYVDQSEASAGTYTYSVRDSSGNQKGTVTITVAEPPWGSISTSKPGATVGETITVTWNSNISGAYARWISPSGTTLGTWNTGAGGPHSIYPTLSQSGTHSFRLYNSSGGVVDEATCNASVAKSADMWVNDAQSERTYDNASIASSGVNVRWATTGYGTVFVRVLKSGNPYETKTGTSGNAASYINNGNADGSTIPFDFQLYADGSLIRTIRINVRAEDPPVVHPATAKWGYVFQQGELWETKRIGYDIAMSVFQFPTDNNAIHAGNYCEGALGTAPPGIWNWSGSYGGYSCSVTYKAGWGTSAVTYDITVSGDSHLPQ